MTATLSPAQHSLPSARSIGIARGKYELRCFIRNREALFFTLFFPVMMLALFGVVFGDNSPVPGMRYAQVLTAGILASGLASVTFVNLSISIATERDARDLKRLDATPMPKAAYFIGKLIQVFVIMVVEIALLLLVGIVLYGVKLPSTAGRWFTFGWLTLLGSMAFGLLGIAMSSLPRNAKSAAAMVNIPFVALQFISGVFVPFKELGSGLRAFASIFPMKWLAQGYRSVFAPDAYLKIEPDHSWLHGQTALVLGAWIAIGFVLCLRTFRWQRDGR